MKKLRQVLIISIAVFLFACSNENTIVFEGESENWIVLYTIKNIDDKKSAYDFDIQIKYKGKADDLLNLSQITFNLSRGTDNLGGDIPTILLDVNKEILFKSSGSYEGVSIPDSHSDIKAMIKWGDLEENLTLKLDN